MNETTKNLSTSKDPNSLPLFKRMVILTNERFPLIVNILLVTGTILALNKILKIPFGLTTFLLTLFINLFLLLLLRWTDELKDHDKDVLAHPLRPIPRGLVKVKELKSIIEKTMILFLAFGALIFLFFSLPSLVFYIITLAWMHLMYKEFFVGTKLQNFPFIYAVLHQLLIIPMSFMNAFILTSNLKSTVPLNSIFILSIIFLSSFFAYEVGRKLNPDAHPALKTYLHCFGKTKVLTLLIILETILFLCLYILGYKIVGYILTTIIFIKLFQWYLKPHLFKKTEDTIALQVLAVSWLIAFVTY